MGIIKKILLIGLFIFFILIIWIGLEISETMKAKTLEGVVYGAKNAIFCDKGDIDACFSLGDSYARGLNGLKKDFQFAANWYDAACNLGSSRGCIASGDVYSLNKFNSLALYSYKKACLMGNKQGCYLFMNLISKGKGLLLTKEKYKKFIKDLKKLCNKKNVDVCSYVGDLYLKIGNYKEAFEFYKKKFLLEPNKLFQVIYSMHIKDFLNTLCNKKHYTWGCIKLGDLYKTGKIGFIKSYYSAADFYKKACDLGDNQGCLDLKRLYINLCDNNNTWGCISLGLLYVTGKKINQNYIKAAELFKKACNLKDSQGCFNLGILYYNGQGVRQSYVKAAKLFKKACDLGNSEGCNKIGVLYARGNLLRQSNVKAAKFFKKACDLGSFNGCTNLGIFYYYGLGVKRNYFKAFNLFKNSCELVGNGEACYYLGILYYNGQGVRQSYTTAKKFFGEACDLKNEKGCMAYSKLNKK